MCVMLGGRGGIFSAARTWDALFGDYIRDSLSTLRSMSALSPDQCSKRVYVEVACEGSCPSLCHSCKPGQFKLLDTFWTGAEFSARMRRRSPFQAVAQPSETPLKSCHCTSIIRATCACCRRQHANLPSQCGLEHGMSRSSTKRSNCGDPF